ncbi:MAG: hypothetical protein AMXMBFR80_19500 [Dehalococcoidia bacterium]
MGLSVGADVGKAHEGLAGEEVGNDGVIGRKHGRNGSRFRGGKGPVSPEPLAMPLVSRERAGIGANVLMTRDGTLPE